MHTLDEFIYLFQEKKSELRSSLFQLENLRINTIETIHKNNFSNATYPYANDIFNLLNPLYLNGICEFDDFAKHDYILIRDGFYPLLDFFFRFARPGRTQIILLIHESLKFVVPEMWSHNVLTYSFQKKNTRKESRLSPSSLYVLATTCGSNIRVKNFSSKISRIKSFYGAKWEEINIKWGIFLRSNPYLQENKEVFSHASAPIVGEIYEQFGLDCKFFGWEDIIKNKDFYNSCYYHIEEDHFSHAYSYIDHFFLSNRCEPFDEGCFTPKKEGDFVVDMFPEYKIHINQFHFQPNNLWEEIMQFANDWGIGGSLIGSCFYPYFWGIFEKYSSMREKVKIPENRLFTKNHQPLLVNNALKTKNLDSVRF